MPVTFPCQTGQAKPPEKAEKFPLPLGVRRTVKSLTGGAVAGFLQSDEKPPGAELAGTMALV